MDSRDLRPSLEVYEATSGVRVGGKFQPFVSGRADAPKDRATFVFRPTEPFKQGAKYLIRVGGTTSTFTTRIDAPNQAK